MDDAHQRIQAAVAAFARGEILILGGFSENGFLLDGFVGVLADQAAF